MWERIQGTPQEKQAESKEAIVEPRVQAVQRDEFTVSSPIIKPAVVNRGNKIFYLLTYTIFSSDTMKEFDVLDVVTLSGSSLLIELSKKASRKTQGSHISTLEFTIPPDLPLGSYKLISLIKIGADEKQQQANFTVKE
jgi:hypothetical protein